MSICIPQRRCNKGLSVTSINRGLVRTSAISQPTTNRKRDTWCLSCCLCPQLMTGNSKRPFIVTQSQEWVLLPSWSRFLCCLWNSFRQAALSKRLPLLSRRSCSKEYLIIFCSLWKKNMCYLRTFLFSVEVSRGIWETRPSNASKTLKA